MIRQVFVVLLCAFAFSAYATEPTTPEQRRKFLFLVQSLEQAPFGDASIIGRGWAAEFVENASDISPRINVGMLVELMNANIPDQLAIFAQYILGASVFVIEHPDMIEDQSANALAAFAGAIRVYDKAMKRDPANRIPFWDELSKNAQAGTLKAHVETLVTERRASPKPK